MDLYDEFVSIIGVLETERIPYAVCGGMAMAIHGLPRATVDVDLLVPGDAAERVVTAVSRLGYNIVAAPMTFADGAVEIRRVSKIAPEDSDVSSLALLRVTPAATLPWTTRTRVAWEGGELSVVSPAGLVALKRLRGSGQDQDDIRHLERLTP